MTLGQEMKRSRRFAVSGKGRRIVGGVEFFPGARHKPTERAFGEWYSRHRATWNRVRVQRRAARAAFIRTIA